MLGKSTNPGSHNDGWSRRRVAVTATRLCQEPQTLEHFFRRASRPQPAFPGKLFSRGPLGSHKLWSLQKNEEANETRFFSCLFSLSGMPHGMVEQVLKSAIVVNDRRVSLLAHAAILIQLPNPKPDPSLVCVSYKKARQSPVQIWRSQPSPYPTHASWDLYGVG